MREPEELVREYFEAMKIHMKEQHQEYMWPSMAGALGGDLCRIMIFLSVFYPRAYEQIANGLDLTVKE